MSATTTHSLLRNFVVWVEDKPGVLNRVASLFRRRAYNIVSLSVGRTHVPGVSRMTIVVEADQDAARRFAANLYKLVNVLRVEDITTEPSITRDLALIKVRGGPDERSGILQVCEVYRARVVDISPASLIVEVTGTRDKIESLLAALGSFGIIEMVQTGSISMQRGAEQNNQDVTPRGTTLAA